MQYRILLQPIGIINQTTLNLLGKSLSEKFSNAKFVIGSSIDIPSNSFDSKRKQFLSPTLLSWIEDKCEDKSYDKILGICDSDAYSDEFDFIFGEAKINGRVAVIYLARLKQKFYGLDIDNSIFHKRVVKEVTHELGHSFGLGHCKNVKCVMYFSNSLVDTDMKSQEFCATCKPVIHLT